MAAGPMSTSFRFGQSSSPGKTLCLLFDGTSNYYDYSNTNVVKLFEILDKSDTSKQICYYQPGIGTYTSPSLITPITATLAKTLDLAFAWYISAHITAGYEFLMANYCPGDKVCIFGFSRGAYTARALAGMLEKVGLIHPDNFEMVNFAYDLYKNWTPKNQKIVKQCERFKQSFARPVPVELLGVFDTVGSVGFIVDRHLPFANRKAAKYFRQACALDEHRVKFPINRYHQNTGDYQDALNDPEHASYPVESVSVAPQQDSAEDSDSRRLPKVLEVWFAGAHADVGGGNALDTTVLQLSNISLNWMIAQILAVHPGIRFDPGRLNIVTTAFSDALISPSARGKQGENGNSGMINSNIEAPVRDPLWNFKGYDGKFSFGETVQTFFWQFLELLPLPQRYQNPITNKWHKTWLPHFGKARVLPPGANVHTSVLDKIALGKYKPRPKIPSDVHYVST